MSKTNKTLEIYQRIITSGHTLNISELRHFDALWAAKLRLAKKEIDKGAVKTMLETLNQRVNFDIDRIINMLGEIP